MGLSAYSESLLGIVLLFISLNSSKKSNSYTTLRKPWTSSILSTTKTDEKRENLSEGVQKKAEAKQTSMLPSGL